jgi:hypothetical protein
MAETVRWRNSAGPPLPVAIRFFLFSRREFCGILQEVPRRTASHAAVDTNRPYCGVADVAGSRQRMDVVCSLPLVPFLVGNLN